MDTKHHPDDVVADLCKIASERGYDIESISMLGHKPMGAEFPRYSYGATKHVSEVVSVAIKEYDRKVLPRRVADIMRDPRR